MNVFGPSDVGTHVSPPSRLWSHRRLLVPVLLVAVLAALPWAVGRWDARATAGSGDLSAARVLAMVQAARSTGWSGTAESRGGLALPVTDVFGDLADLAGGTTTSRAWWRAPLQWRVDVLSAVGERDTIRDPAGSWAWDYQAASTTRTAIDPATRVRLPEAVDLLPPTLGGRLLSEALPGEAGRLPGRSIAGRDTVGLRIHPAQPESTVDHVDVWADLRTGVPLRVEVWAAGAATAAMTSTFLDVDLAVPTPAAVSFTPPAGTHLDVRSDPRAGDIASAVDRLSPVRPPSSLAGLGPSPHTPPLGAIGIYGRGVTELVAVPLQERYAGSLRAQLAGAATAASGPDGTVELGVGPLHLLVTPDGDRGRFWLLAGTVTPDTLRRAAGELGVGA